MIHPNIVFDGCDLHAATRPNPHSPLELIIDGDDVTISEMGEVLATAKLEPPQPWYDKRISDGTTLREAFSGTFTTSNIIVSNRCHSYDSGRGCRYCGLGYMFAQGGPLMDFSETLKFAERQIEATSIAVQSGWRGMILFVGGATTPGRRGQWTTDLFEAFMECFHKYLDDDTLSQLSINSSVYPSPDLGHLYKWKSCGITSTVFSNEIMDPAYFKAICPGKGEQRYWFETQEAAVEVFGIGSSLAALVTGIEPMAGMLEGIEERISKGVMTGLQIFQPMLGAPMNGMQPASAEWYMEAFEKTRDIYSRHGYPGLFSNIEDPHVPTLADDLLHPGSDIERGPGMAITANTTIADVLKEKPNAREILAKHMGQPVDESRLSQGMGMSIQQVAGYIGWNQEKIDAFVKDLNES